jgi:hypothetical protein
MSYGKKNKKIPVSWFLAPGVSQDCGIDLPRRQTYTTYSDFRKELAAAIRVPFPTIPSRRVMLVL